MRYVSIKFFSCADMPDNVLKAFIVTEAAIETGKDVTAAILFSVPRKKYFDMLDNGEIDIAMFSLRTGKSSALCRWLITNGALYGETVAIECPKE